ncbi:acyltransferase domain-containing protein [Actinokineospora spheciospongiae]|uniref:acyltransferase domain-containing protein n=1 Tax=Actinokineospora spheciospongiae TaxID=909613 RepID=UPI000D71ACEE|nr:acyltransferase domain-containing protein [Actinokineospora spheciospongiae]PWW54911.1 malonyl CoA-acyl carrier protein transacylase [Actinokineospora spheciospongiae]
MSTEHLLLAAPTPAALVELLDRPGVELRASRPTSAPGPRLGLLDPTDERLALARKVVAKGREWRARKDIWFSPAPLLPGGAGIAFLYPGLEAEFDPSVDDVADWLGVPRPDLSTDTLGRHGASVVAVGRLLDAALRRLGITPAAVAGHSVGEWTAMICGGLFSGADFDAMLTRTDLDALRVPGVEFAVLGCPADRAAEAVDGVAGVVVSHENSTNQTVVCGPAEAIAGVVEDLRARSVICQVMPFRSGFHTPMLAPYLAPFRESGVPSLRVHPAHVPVWSATTARPFPADPGATRELCVRHLLEPVRFRDLVLDLHAEGIRAFVQAGPGQLGSLVDDTLREHDHLTVAANAARSTGMRQLRRTALALWVEGAAPDFAALDQAPTRIESAQRPAAQTSAGTAATSAGTAALATSATPASATTSTTAASATPAAAPASTGTPASAASAALPTAPGAGFAAPGGRSAPAAAPPVPAVAGVSALADLRALADRYPAFAELDALVRETADSITAVLAAAHSTAAYSTAAPTAAPRSTAPHAAAPTAHPAAAVPEPVLETSLTVSTRDMPYLLDHCFAHQRPGWTDETDRRPVMPATTVLWHMVRAAEAAAPGRVVTGVEGLRLHQWLVAAPAHTLTITVRPMGTDRLQVRVGQYADALVLLGDEYAPGPLPWEPAADERPPALTAARLYDERWLFHGPAYQGITRTVGMSETSARAELTAPAAPGALLDNAGQLIGQWLVECHPRRWIAFPVSVRRIRFHAPEPVAGSTVDCALRLVSVDDREATVDLRLSAGGRTVVDIEGWVDHRFDSDPDISAVHRFPETSTLSRRHDGGWWRADERWASLASREFYLRKYLGAAERAEYERCPPRERREWLLGRIVLKDAVRGRLWDTGFGPLFPAEVEIATGADGGLVARGRQGLELPALDLAVATCRELGVAVVADPGTRPVVAVVEVTGDPATAEAAALARAGRGTATTEIVGSPPGLPDRRYAVAHTARPNPREQQ